MLFCLLLNFFKITCFENPFRNTISWWVNLHAFCRLLNFFKSTFSKISLRNSIRVSNSLEPDQARHFVRPDLGPNCLQRLSADKIRPLRDRLDIYVICLFVLMFYIPHNNFSVMLG